jgi:excisionase family DNA binding protein
MFGISRDSVKRLITKGTLRSIMVGGRRLIPASEVERVERDGVQNEVIHARNQ